MSFQPGQRAYYLFHNYCWPVLLREVARYDDGNYWSVDAIEESQDLWGPGTLGISEDWLRDEDGRTLWALTQ